MEICVAKKILTHGAFGNHVTEVTFPHPVLLTTARVGAVPSSGGLQQTQLLLFAQDAAAPAAARFTQLCPGFEQPPHGTRSVHLQPCVTTRILVRGEYQTVPLSLYGKPVEAAGPQPVARQRLTLPSALQWLQQQEGQAKQQQQQQQQQPHGEAVSWQDAPLQPAVAALLSRLIMHWDVVGTSERLMALNPPPTSLFKDVAACADGICGQLVTGSFGDTPIALDPQPAVQQQATGKQAGVKDAPLLEEVGTADWQQSDVAVGGGVASAELLLDVASDMVLGWCCMLGAGAAGRTSAAVRCSTAGLAAAVLLCSCGAGARRMASRWGAVPLDDVLTMPRAPPSFTRYSVTACLLIARCGASKGAASLLGMWRPAHGIVWQSPARQQQAAQAPAASIEEAGNDQAAVGDEFHSLAAQELGQPLCAAPEAAGWGSDGGGSQCEQQSLSGMQQEAQKHADVVGQQDWQLERQFEDEEASLYGGVGSEGRARSESDGYGEVEPFDEPAGQEQGQGEGHTQSPVTEQRSIDSGGQQGEQASGEALVSGAGTADADEFGSDVYADLGTPQQQQARAEGTAQPQTAPTVAHISTGPAGAASPLDDGEDDLYGGLELGLGATIPQIDGAADVSPRRRRSGGADFAERWALGSEDDAEGAGRRPTEERSSSRRRRHKDRSSEKSEKRRKRKDSRKEKSRKDKGRSREHRESRHRERNRYSSPKSDGGAAAERQRREMEAQQRDAEEGRQRQEAQLRRRHEQEQQERQRYRQHEEERRLLEEQRWQQREELQRKRRYEEQQQRLVHEQRFLQRQGEEQRRAQREEEQRHLKRKRERSPAAGGAGARSQGEPEGKQARTADAAHAKRGQSGAAAASEHAKQQQPPQQQPAALDELGKWELHEAQQRRRMRSYWELKEKAYRGCASHVALHLLQQVQPQRLATVSLQLLHLLGAHKAAASFQAAAEQLVAAHSQQQTVSMPTAEVSVLVAGCSASLEELAELMAKPLPTKGVSTAYQSGHQSSVCTLPPPLVELISSRGLLSLLAALFHVPTAHRRVLEQQGQDAQAATAQQAALMEAALQQQLAAGAKALLAVLASDRPGRRLLLGTSTVLEQLLLATDAGCLTAPWPGTAGVSGAALLQHLVVAEAAVGQLCDGTLDGQVVAVAAETAVALLHECGAIGRQVLVQALALQARVAVPRLLLMLQTHCLLLRTACGLQNVSSSVPAEDRSQANDTDFEMLLAAAPACTHAPELLLALTTATHHDALGYWQQCAATLHLACLTELQQLEALPPAAAAAVAGLGATKSALASLVGAAMAVLESQQHGCVSSVLTYLKAQLPALVDSLSPTAADDSHDDGSWHPAVRSVSWPSVEALFCDAGKLARCEQSLRLLSSALWAPGALGRAASYQSDGDGAALLMLRAVLTGVELADASAADDWWQVWAGHSIDVGEAAACRRRALSFLSAAAAATSCLLQHLRGSACPMKSPSLLAGLLRAHAALCCQEESLSCMMGGMTDGVDAAGVEGMEVAVVARQHLASCLRCYVEAAKPWQPPLLQQVFWGTPALGLEPGQVAAQTPLDMFSTLCLLGDLFPVEWPAAGHKATQAPPCDRKYRATIATAVEPCAASFRRLIGAALTSESRTLRAAVVRVLARAAGLGGGMGPFLVEPLLEELQTVVESPTPLHDARRLLEVIVPLVYRPAIKSAMLSAPFTSTLAQVIGVLVGKLSSGEEGEEAVNVCTMAMEAVVVLFNHEVCLNPLASRQQQQLDDMPPLAEAVAMARALLELLPSMGANALLGHRVLRLMAAAETGCQALRCAVVTVHAAATGVDSPKGQPGIMAVAQAAQWVANRYWTAAERLKEVGAAGGLEAVYTDIVAIMQQICIAPDEQLPSAPLSAQQRFVAALQASLQAAAAAGLDVGGNEHRWEAPSTAEMRVADLVHDSATRMFWRNVRTRAASVQRVNIRRFSRTDCLSPSDLSLEALLHPPLTLPRQVPGEPPILEQRVQQQQQHEPGVLHLAPAEGPPPVSPPALHAVKGVQRTPGVSTDMSPQLPAVKSEPEPLQQSESVSMKAMDDMYGDLALQHRVSGSLQFSPQQQQQPPRERPQQPGEGVVSADHQTHGRGKTEAAGAIPLQPASTTGTSGVMQAAHRSVDNVGTHSLQSLLASPATLQALLKDPVQLQRLLEKHPSLMTLLKSKLQKS